MTPARWRLRVFAVLALTLSVACAASAGLDASSDVDVDAYRRAEGGGSIQGRVHGEPRASSGTSAPYADVRVALLPRSERFLQRLHAIKGAARSSHTAFGQAITDMRNARDDFERQLREGGSADLPESAVTDADGRFAFDTVPAGRWIVLAWRTVPLTKKPGKPLTRDQRRFALDLPTGSQAVSVWLREMTLGAGAQEVLDLSDRNTWFTGFAEVRAGAGH